MVSLVKTFNYPYLANTMCLYLHFVCRTTWSPPGISSNVVLVTWHLQYPRKILVSNLMKIPWQKFNSYLTLLIKKIIICFFVPIKTNQMALERRRLQCAWSMNWPDITKLVYSYVWLRLDDLIFTFDLCNSFNLSTDWLKNQVLLIKKPLL